MKPTVQTALQSHVAASQTRGLGQYAVTIIGIPLGIPLFAAGLGLMLTPKERSG